MADAQSFTQDQRQSMWQAAGHAGIAPVGYGGESSSNSGGQSFDPVANAQKLLDFQKQANAPVVTALQGQVPGIQDKYTQLVNSIKGNQQLDTNRQTLTTNNQLGARGINPQSGVYQQELTNALTPIDTQYAGLTANANAGSIQDLQGLALQIAQLQAGDPNAAIGQALQYGGLQSQAAQTAASIQQAQIYGSAQIAAAQAHPYQALGNNGITLNTATGGVDTSGLATLIRSLNNL